MNTDQLEKERRAASEPKYFTHHRIERRDDKHPILGHFRGVRWWLHVMREKGLLSSMAVEFYPFTTRCSINLSVSCDCEDNLSFSIALPFLFSFYITFNFNLSQSPRVKRFWEWWVRPEGHLDDREYSLSIHDWSVMIKLDARRNEWNSTDPFWTDMSFNVLDTLFGRSTYVTDVVDRGTATLRMPEKDYPVEWCQYFAIYKRPRALWGKTIPKIDLEFPTPIPFPGKGTTDYNCGEDARHSSTLPYLTLNEALEKTRDEILHLRATRP